MFLLTRGIWLIAVEVFVLHVLVWFSLDFSFVGPLQVIWAIGWSMIALAALRAYLPVRAIAVFGIAMIALHNTLDGVTSQAFAWMVLHQAGTVMLTASGPLVWVQYPLVPWIGVMAAGYAFGALHELEAAASQSHHPPAWVVLIAAFVVTPCDEHLMVIRRRGQSAQPTALFTALSFINTTEIPAVAAVPADDARSGARRVGMVRIAVEIGQLPTSNFQLPGPTSPRQQAAWELGIEVGGFLRAALSLRSDASHSSFYLWQWVLAHAAAIVANIVARRPFDYLCSRSRPSSSTCRGARVFTSGRSMSAGPASSRLNTLCCRLVCGGEAAVAAIEWLSSSVGFREFRGFRGFSGFGFNGFKRFNGYQEHMVRRVAFATLIALCALASPTPPPPHKAPAGPLRSRASAEPSRSRSMRARRRTEACCTRARR